MEACGRRFPAMDPEQGVEAVRMATGKRSGTERGHRVAWVALLLGVAGWQGAFAPAAGAEPPRVVAADASVQAAAEPAKAIGVELQPRREWRFEEDGVVFDNRLPDARLNGVERIRRHRYRITVAPETQPINPSPWYGFEVRSAQPRTLRIEFRYAAARHRYSPWLSEDGGAHWRRAGEREFRADRGGGPLLKVAVGPHPLRVFAQPPVGLEDVRTWTESLARRVPLRDEVVGRSVQGRPLHLLSFGDPAARDVLLVLGRQHPPEVTGMRALMAFVDALAGDSAEATAFRASHRVLVAPVVNPDGVAEGHWRTNLGGTDLNRDWGVFREPETRALRDALWREIDGAGRRVVFALDFHSTWHDVFYTVTEDPARAPGGVLRAWMDAMQARYPGRIRESASAASSAVFKNWAFRRFGAPTVTYEVGDNTGREALDELARFAAAELMRLLQAAPAQAGTRSGAVP